MKLRLAPVFIAAVICVMLTGCISNESPCHFFQLYQKEMYNNKWNVDSLHMYWFNTNTQLGLDTMCYNYGSLKFVSDDPYSCTDNGNLVITGGGHNAQIGYSTGVITVIPAQDEGYVIMNQICLQTAAPIDGYNTPYSLCSYDSIWPGHIKIYGDNSQNGPDSIVRYWEFYLSAK